jgi:energy-coupling factor transporter transmembrane protein EcfT
MLTEDFPPVFRLAALIALGAVVFRYSLTAQLCLAVVLCLLAAWRGSGSLDQIVRALRRIRWLLLSLAIIYLLIAPEPELSGRARFMPGWADLELALRRAGVLVLLVSAVELMRQTTPAAEIAAAIGQLLRPLRRFGINTERFSRRVALTLDAVPRTAEAVAAAAGRTGIRGRDLTGWSEAAAALVRDIEGGATHTSMGAGLPTLPGPTPADWIKLFALLGVIFGLTWV